MILIKTNNKEHDTTRTKIKARAFSLQYKLMDITHSSIVSNTGLKLQMMLRLSSVIILVGAVSFAHMLQGTATGEIIDETNH